MELQGLGEVHSGVLRPGVGVMNRVVSQGISLPGAERRGLGDGAFDERGVLGR
jgi:hypothetical protein